MPFEEDKANFENANDYLLNVITATMAQQQSDPYGCMFFINLKKIILQGKRG